MKYPLGFWRNREEGIIGYWRLSASWSLGRKRPNPTLGLSVTYNRKLGLWFLALGVVQVVVDSQDALVSYIADQFARREVT